MMGHYCSNAAYFNNFILSLYIERERCKTGSLQTNIVFSPVSYTEISICYYCNYLQLLTYVLCRDIQTQKLSDNQTLHLVRFHVTF